MQIIDAKGLACPQPVILTKKALEQYNEVKVIVDNEVAVENIKRLCNTLGVNFEVLNENETFSILISKSNDTKELSNMHLEDIKCNLSSQVLLISSDKMGKGNDELGEVLIKAFIHTLTNLNNKPNTIIFYNTGVKLTVQDSPVIDDLKLLQDEGVKILICGTCVNFFNIKDKIKIGNISNMYDIASIILDINNKVVLP